MRRRLLQLRQLLLHRQPFFFGGADFVIRRFAGLPVGFLMQTHRFFARDAHFHLAPLEFFFQFALLFLRLFTLPAFFFFAGLMFFPLPFAPFGLFLQQRFQLFALLARLLGLLLKFCFKLLPVLFNFRRLPFRILARLTFRLFTGLPLGFQLFTLFGGLLSAALRFLLRQLRGLFLLPQLFFQLAATRLRFLHLLLGRLPGFTFGFLTRLQFGLNLSPLCGGLSRPLFGQCLRLPRFFLAP